MATRWAQTTVYAEDDLKEVFDNAAKKIPGVNSTSQFLREAALLYLQTTNPDLLKGENYDFSGEVLSLQLPKETEGFNQTRLEEIVFNAVNRAVIKANSPRKRSSGNYRKPAIAN